MDRGSLAPKMGNTKESIKKNFEWWEAEHDRAAWEDDNTPESVKQERTEKWKSYMNGIELAWWMPGDISRPYHENRESWRSKNITLQK